MGNYFGINPGKLEDLVLTNRFRTVERESWSIPCGESEVPVLIDVDDALDAALSFQIPKRRQFLGFAVLGNELTSVSGIKRLYINKIRNIYVLIAERDKQKDLKYSIETNDLAELLENALRPPSQLIKK